MRNFLPAVILAFTAIPASAVLTVQFTVWNETCGNGNGAIQALVQGGSGPYQYEWSNGGSDYIVTGLTPGWYVLTVTDALNETLVDSAQVLAVPNLHWPMPQQFPQGGLFGCGGCNAGIHFIPDPNLFNWYNVTGMMTLNSPVPLDDLGANGYVLGPYCEWDQITITVTDGTGCTGTVPVASPLFVSTAGPMALLDVQGACLGANGSIEIDHLGGGFLMDQFTITLYDDGWNTITSCNTGFCTLPTITYANLAAGDYHIVRLEQYYDPYGMSCLPETLDVAVPDLGPTCGQVNGTLFFDHGQDCAQDPNDEPIPYRVMEISPGPEYVMTNAAGTFSRNLAYGSYTLDQQAGADLIQICPVADPIPFTVSAASPLVTLAIADSSAIPFDLQLQCTHGPTRLGFDVNYSLVVRNLSGALSGPITATFTIDPVMGYVSASPTPTGIAGNELSWDLAALGAFGQHAIQVTVNIPANIGLLGTPVTCSAGVSNTVAETDLTNNTALFPSTITAAYDPNDKRVLTNGSLSDSQFIINTDEWLDYSIRFQNTGTDTAFTVVIVDTLPATLDPLSFQPGAASHPYEVDLSGAGIVSFTFADILLPDSTVNEPASHGYVGFRIRPQQPVLPGTMISNAADILFDFNPPVHTNDAVVVTETSTSVSEAGAASGAWVFPNPTRDDLSVALDGNALLEVLDPSGRVVLRANGSGPLQHLNVGGLAPGHYVLRVVGATGTRWARFTKAG